jgi:uncharacterized lipoprotein YddW (UPF0748 family)
VDTVQAAEVPASADRRGLWVLCEGAQRVLEHPERVATLLADAEALGVTDLFVQVYRGGRAWFPTALADDSPSQQVRFGGADTLTALIEGAHARGLRVHGWVNMLSLAKNSDAPILKALGRDAVIVDHKGRSLLDYPDFEVPMPDRQFYRMGTPAVWLDPALPAVRDHLSRLMADLVTGYPELDGIHFDYIRYADSLPFAPGSRFGVGLGFGFGAASRGAFQAETGLKAPFGASLSNANAWDDWRRDQLTALVREAGGAARAARPGLAVSAAVISDRERAYLVDHQDWLTWLDSELLDFAVPMLYTRDPVRMRHGVETIAGLATMSPTPKRRDLWIGIGSWLFAESPGDGVAQLRQAEAPEAVGTALFSWDSIRETPDLLSALATEVARERAALDR